MDPRDFQALADRLAQGSSAAECRSAISRAYYATFNVAMQVLRAWTLTPPDDAKGHGEVRNYLANSNNIELAKVATTLNGLYRDRVQADYRMSSLDAENPNTAFRAVRLAKDAIDVLDRVNSSEAERKAAAATLKAWERSPRRSYTR